ncbi:FAD-binding oxidoreductase [Vampirovibrio chlorellavorus]|uniref:FAD-binding oxidoreductase n=1 Tax=Vampirovibrio chlorellavorus TaxID=758823 RepID=UPI0026F28982|nr:FAD-binding oxidoreductase [Vampirovibrio chlorellavorus]
MDIAASSASLSLKELQQMGLACPWEFDTRSGHKLSPQTPAQVARLLQWAQSQKKPVALTPTDAALLPEALWLDLSSLNRVRQHAVADFIIQVECGMTYRELLATVAPHRQIWPLSYPPTLTIGQILAEERPALHTGLRGYPRDYVLKVEVATPDGQVTISGADVVKNVTGYDLAKLYIGGYHQFGVLTSVTLKLAALPETRQQWRLSPDSLNQAFPLVEQILASGLALNVCELFQDQGQWRLLLELAGDEAIVKAQAADLSGQFTGSPTVLDTRSGEALLFELQQFPAQQTILEAAFPLSQWQDFVSQVSKQPSLGSIRIQVRPAAGLVYLFANQLPFAALRYLKEQTEAHQGFLQIKQIAPEDVTNASEATSIYADANLPQNPAVRDLLRRLKNSYDPGNILFAAQLSLT